MSVLRVNVWLCANSLLLPYFPQNREGSFLSQSNDGYLYFNPRPCSVLVKHPYSMRVNSTDLALISPPPNARTQSTPKLCLQLLHQLLMGGSDWNLGRGCLCLQRCCCIGRRRLHGLGWGGLARSAAADRPQQLPLGGGWGEERSGAVGSGWWLAVVCGLCWI